MKVYQVTKSYFDGDHDHGLYQSPLFSTREAAEEFLAKVMAGKDDNWDDFYWHSYYDSDYPSDCDPLISEIEVLEACPAEIQKARNYRQET